MFKSCRVFVSVFNLKSEHKVICCVYWQGRFEIISLSGSYMFSENNGNRSRSGGLSVSLAGSDGSVLGGGVAGMLVAAGPVQVTTAPNFLLFQF